MKKTTARIVAEQPVSVPRMQQNAIRLGDLLKRSVPFRISGLQGGDWSTLTASINRIHEMRRLQRSNPHGKWSTFSAAMLMERSEDGQAFES